MRLATVPFAFAASPQQTSGWLLDFHTTFRILWYNGKMRGSDLEKYRVHRFDVKMTSDAQALEDFLNGLRGDVVAIIPNVTSRQFEYASVDFLLIVEKTIS